MMLYVEGQLTMRKSISLVTGAGKVLAITVRVTMPRDDSIPSKAH